ncbi:MAG: isoleucyl-tRNA synthetase, partial [Patescibacteria group bacterium]|nr:isoleucyl-tRNA synthetase [Patescibacteria group bacterium]
DIVDDLSTWYLRRSRDRFKGDDMKDKEQAMQTTRFALLTLSKLVAPFIPFMAEHIYQNVRSEIARVSSTSAILMPESVHLTDWPTLPMVDHTLIDSMTAARKLVEAGLAIRAKSGIKVRQPLASFTYTDEFTNSESGVVLSEGFLQIIKEELNVKEVKKGTELALDTNLTTELKEEGVVRDVIRGAQEARKNAGLVPSDDIVLSVSASAETVDVLKKNEEMLKKPIQAVKVEYVEVGESSEGGEISENGKATDIGLVELEGEKVLLKVSKI